MVAGRESCSGRGRRSSAPCASTEERTWTRHRADPNRRRATWPRPCCACAGRPPCLHPLADRDARARRGRRGASPGRPGPDCPSGPHRRRSDRPTGPLAGSRRSGHNHGTITTTPGRSDPRGALHWTSRDSHRGRRHNRPGQSERRCALRSDRPKPGFQRVILDGDRRSDRRYLEISASACAGALWTGGGHRPMVLVRTPSRPTLFSRSTPNENVALSWMKQRARTAGAEIVEGIGISERSKLALILSSVPHQSQSEPAAWRSATTSVSTRFLTPRTRSTALPKADCASRQFGDLLERHESARRGLPYGRPTSSWIGSGSSRQRRSRTRPASSSPRLPRWSSWPKTPRRCIQRSSGSRSTSARTWIAFRLWKSAAWCDTDTVLVARCAGRIPARLDQIREAEPAIGDQVARSAAFASPVVGETMTHVYHITNGPDVGDILNSVEAFKRLRTTTDRAATTSMSIRSTHALERKSWPEHWSK